MSAFLFVPYFAGFCAWPTKTIPSTWVEPLQRLGLPVTDSTPRRRLTAVDPLLVSKAVGDSLLRRLQVSPTTTVTVVVCTNTDTTTQLGLARVQSTAEGKVAESIPRPRDYAAGRRSHLLGK